MTSCYLFLLIYLTAICCCWGTSDAKRVETCHTQEQCTQVENATSVFLQCVGLPARRTGRDHLQNLRDAVEASLDLYSFMRSSLSQSPLTGLELSISVNPEAEAYQKEDLVKVWVKLKLKPLLSSISRGFLICLSNKNFSCSTYQTMVQEMSDHFSEMDPVRQRWIYMFFMYPFLSRTGAGCVIPRQSSKDWLVRNFGSFKAVARMKDLKALNMVFSGLEVLDLLTSEQKAELLLSPGVESFENGTLTLLFHTLLTEVNPPVKNNLWTTPGYLNDPPSYTPAYPPGSDNNHSPQHPQSQESLREVVNGLMGVFRPFGSFIREFVSLTQERPLSEIRSSTLTQVVLNWTLAELAGRYRPQEGPEAWLDPLLDVEDWYNHVVVPVLRRVLPPEQTHIPSRLKAVFHRVFYLNGHMENMENMENETAPPDVCSITLEERSCGLTNAVEKVARVLHCVARSNLTMSEETVMGLVRELTGRLNSLVQDFSTANFSELAHHFREVFGHAESPALTHENLNDPEFIRLWFQIKLKPLLPSIPTRLLSCLSTKNFTCPVYQALVEELSLNIYLMNQKDEQNIYSYFLFPFLLNHNSSDPQCISSASSSTEWLTKNFGGFSVLAPLTDFYYLNANFSALSALKVLSPTQTAELVLLSLPGPGKDVVINTVFDFLTASPTERRFPEFLQQLVLLSAEVTVPCQSYKIIFERLYKALEIVPLEMEPVVWSTIDHLTLTSPADCLPMKCPVTPSNDTRICEGVNSYGLESYLDVSNSSDVPCNFTLEEYACASLNNFTADNLVSLLKCELTSNASQSKETWKFLLTKVTSVLDNALDVFSNMSMPLIGPAVSEVLDVIGEIRLNLLTDEQLRNSDVIRTWFSQRLSVFLPSASAGFLHCLSTRNLSCDSYQQILKEFGKHFNQMGPMRQELVLKFFIVPFLSQNSSGPGCVSNSNGSVDWLQKNLGPFSALVSITELLNLNTAFSPLSALEVLSPKQTAELVVLSLPGPGNDVIINTVFDFLTASPTERRFPEFLQQLVLLSAETPVRCPVYQIIFVRLYQAMSALPSQLEPIIWASVYDLTASAPIDCVLIPVDQQCPMSPNNATSVCAGVDSSTLQHLLDSGIMTGDLCNYSIRQYACSQLTNLTVDNLVTLLKCKLSENNTYSTETWKLFLTKASAVLDQALDILSNQSKPLIGPAVSQALDVIGQIRVNRLTENQLRNSDVIRTWFSGRLSVFLPSASAGFLFCLSTRNLSCDSYQAVVTGFGAQFDEMSPAQQLLVLNDLIIPFLSGPTSGGGCVSTSNGSVDWLQKNFGPFSALVSITELLNLNTAFTPLSALTVLSPKQTAELVVFSLPGLPGKDVVINTVFDFLIASPTERRFPEFLQQLVIFSAQIMLPCDTYKIIFERLYQVSSSVPLEMEPVVWSTIDHLTLTSPADCLPMKCPVTPSNDTRICEGVNSYGLESYLDVSNSSDVPCNFTLEEYACASLNNFTADNLVSLLKCELTSNASQSKETWKFLLTKVTSVLDNALDVFSNMSMPLIGPAVSEVLDVIGEIRLNLLTDEQLRNSDVIRTWFSQRLSVFLPSASAGFLHCLSTRNLSCDSYQQILKEFGKHFNQMGPMRQELVLKFFIVPFLSQNSSGPGCVSNSNGSVDWLQKNLGPFSALVSITELLNLNTAFSPLSALEVLSPKQTAELVVLSLPGPGNDVIINTVFDFLTASPTERRFPEFLQQLVLLSAETPVRCPVYQIIFVRLYQAMSALPSQLEPIIWASVYDLTASAPIDCVLIPVDQQCPMSPNNATSVCAGVDSSTLQHLLDTGIMTGDLCNYSIRQYACSQLTNLTVDNLVTLLKCKLSENNTYSTETWKLFLTKASAVLDQALDILSNQSKPLIGPAVSQALDVIGQIRVNRLTENQLRNSDVIRTWFSGRLSVFLPSASAGFLFCLSTRNLSCDSYQAVVTGFGAQFDEMSPAQQLLVLNDLIIPFLSGPTSGGGCVSTSNGSVDWLQKNFGPFSALVSITELLNLNTAFTPLSALTVLSPKQTAELVVFSLPGLPGKDVVINTVFDFLIASPTERRFPEFLQQLVIFSAQIMLPCDTYKIIFERLYQVSSSVPLEMEPVVWSTIDHLTLTSPADCLPMKCPVTPSNDTRICEGVNSYGLESYLDVSNSSDVPCNFTLEEYACASLNNFTADNLVSLLKCELTSNASQSKETWKFLLTKVTSVLDNALDVFSNMSMPLIGPAVSEVLDVIGEIRLNLLTDEQLRNSDVIRTWFSQRLSVFLPSASAGFLHCLSTRNLSCDSYQQILKEFGKHFNQMGPMRQELVLKFFIVPFLSQNSSGPGCVSNSNGSVDWLQKNLGPFSALVSITELLNLNTAFSPLSALEVLSPKQTAELVVLSLPGPGNDVIINTVFDFLTASPTERRFPEFLQQLVLLSAETPVRCPVYQIIFVRLYQAMSALPSQLEPIIWASVYDLTASAPIDCVLIPVDQQCPMSPNNATSVCAGVDSSTLQHLLDTGIMTGDLCNYSIRQYACSQLTNLTVDNLVTLLKCKLSENNTYSTETWKLFLTKASAVLDQALDILSNQSKPLIGPAVSQALDVIGQIRVNRLTENQLRNSDVIRTWFSGRLSVFLPSASAGFLFCLSTRNLSCDSYQAVVTGFGAQFDEMSPAQQLLVLNDLIIPFLSGPTSGGGCVSTSNGSVDWLQKNFGPFSALVSITELLNLNTAFTPLSALTVLSPKQTAELVVFSLPGLPGNDVIINTVFDFLTASPTERRFPEFLQQLVLLSAETPVRCPVYQIIFVRLYQAMSALPSQLEPIIWASVYDLTASAPIDCVLIPVDQQCPMSPNNATSVCAGVDSSTLQHLLDTGIMTGDLCNYSIRQYACSQLTNLTVDNLVTLLKCKLSENNTYSTETWKLFLTKASAVLDQALDILSNQSKPLIGPAVSQALDVIGQIRVNRLTENQLRNSDVIRTWFSGRLSVFLPSASAGFLFCLSTRNLSCDSYQAVVTGFGAQFDEMSPAQQLLVLNDLIIPFLSGPTSGGGCVSTSNGSVDWLQKNFGPFSALVSITELLNLNTAFTPLSALTVLSPKQTAELVVFSLPGLPGKDVVINTVFDFLIASPTERRFPEFLQQLVIFSAQIMLPCDTYKIIFERLYQVSSSVPLEMEPVVWSTIDHLTLTSPADCLPMKCPVTPSNDTRICEGVNSYGLESYLDVSNSSDVPCNFTLEEYACASLNNFTADNLVSLLKCELTSNASQSKETWKFLLTKVTSVLDNALDVFSNMSMPLIGPAVSEVLDVIGEIRLNLLTDEQLRNSDVIRTWFSQRLSVFLPSASAGFLHCLSTRNLSCDSYQQILKEFGKHFNQMGPMRQELVLKFFIVPFLSQNSSGPGCVSNSNGSVDWLQKNLGPFSALVSITELLNLNTAFSPLSALEVLSPKQTAELVVLSLPGPGNDVIINTVFDFLTASPTERRFPEFLQQLVLLSAETPVRCPVYQIIFVRLYQAMSALPSQLEPIIWASVYDLTASAPIDCVLIPVDQQCPMSPNNATSVCAGVDSSTLQHLLDTGIMTGDLCNYSIRQYACSQLTNLTVDNLVTLLKCKLSENNTYSTETWKLFLTKASAVLDQALDILSNQSKPLIGPAVSQALDVIGQIRVNRLTENQLRNSDVIRTWFSGRLSVFLPSASAGFLFCLSTRNLSCDSYQAVVTGFGAQFDEMSPAQQLLVLNDLIIPFLSGPTSGGGCVSTSNGSVDWLQKNFGPFSALVSITELLNLNTAFTPLSALTVLSPKQTAELVVFSLPGLPGKDVVINTVFDFLIASPTERRFPEFLQQLVIFSAQIMLPCDTYKIIFERLYQVSSSVPLEMEPVVWSTIDHLTLTSPADCLPMKCPVTPSNDTRICEGVNSYGLESYLDVSNSSDVPCNFTLEEYACASLNNFTADNLVSLLKCELTSNASQSKETWKFLLTKVTSVLDNALDVFSNMSMPLIGPAVSEVLDVIGEIRLNLLTDEQLRNSDVIRTWFSQRLSVFLPSASAGFLHCLGTRNLSCDSYQQILKEFGKHFNQMGPMRQELVLKFFIVPFLSQNSSGPGCVSNSNGSVDWLQKNLGPFSALVSITELLNLNTAFSPLSALEVLSPKQTAELVVLSLPGPGNDVIINTVFDFLTASPTERRFPEFLQQLVLLSAETPVICPVYQIIFVRLYQAMSALPSQLEPIIWASVYDLTASAPIDCVLIPVDQQCPMSPNNATSVCAGVDSSTLQHLLDTGIMTGDLCNYSIRQYACSQLTNLTVDNLVTLLKCKLSENNTYSTETWKLFLTKASAVLDQALDILSNQSKPLIGPAVSQALDVIGQIRVNRLTENQLRNSDVIRTWFSGRLSMFLPSASAGFLFCLSTRNLSCDSYQAVVTGFGAQFDEMSPAQQLLVLNDLIIPFLSGPTSGGGCVSTSNGSVDWLQKNFGPFSALVSITELLNLNTAFTPLSALTVLSPKQTAELVVFSLPGLPGKDVVINTVFDFLTASPTERRFPEFLQQLAVLSMKTPVSCPVYQNIFVRLSQAMSALPSQLEPIIWASVYDLTASAPIDCVLVPADQQCPASSNNLTTVCSGVDSSTLQHLLDTGIMTGDLCNYSIRQYACSQLTNLTADNLVTLLKCKLSENNTYSTETWKLFLTKASAVLDQALDILSNQSKPLIGPAVSQALDVIGQIRVNRLTEDQLRNSDVIRTWFSQRLSVFLPSASAGFLHCLSTRNLSCDSYQAVVTGFGAQFDEMSPAQQLLVLNDLIIPFLSGPTSGGGCVSTSNGSVDWLQKNFGPFSVLVSLGDLLTLNTGFTPLSVLDLLSPKQTAELVVFSLPGLPGKDVVINTVFDFLTASPTERRFPEFLQQLAVLSMKTPVSCPVYQNIFVRLSQAMSALPSQLEPIIWASVYDLTASAPIDCVLVPADQQCPTSSNNLTTVCSGVDSSTLQHLLDTGIMTGDLCNYSIRQYACSQLTNLTADNLVTLLKCKLSENNTYSTETWKLFLTKASAVLDQALDILSNQSKPLIGPAVSQALDVIGQIRVNRLTEDQLRNSDVIRTWFSGRLSVFLPSASAGFLHCLGTRNLSCDSYQAVVTGFGAQFDEMSPAQQLLVLNDLIIPFLSRPTTGGGCVSTSNSSVDWLQKNFGPFSVLVSITELLNLNTAFTPLSALKILSPKQTAELVVFSLPGLPGNDVIINTVFDFLTASPTERRFPEFLQQLVSLSQQNNISCASYKLIFNRLDQAVPIVTTEIVSALTSSKTALLQSLPPGCIVFTGTCNFTPVNETAICAGVNSTALQSFLNNGQISTVLCNYSIDVYACSSLSVLTSVNLASLLRCELNGNSSQSVATWKLFFSKVSGVLDSALDLFANTTLDPSSTAVSQVLDAIREVRLDSFSSAELNSPDFINLWFNIRLGPFLPAVSNDFLSCLSTYNFSCSTYQNIIQILSSYQSAMVENRQISVYTYFIQLFLSRNNTADPGCRSGVLSSGDWLLNNLGGFSVFVSLADLQRLFPNFSALDVLSQLSVQQLSQVASTPGQLSSAADVSKLMNNVPNSLFYSFFTDFSTAITGRESLYPVAVLSAMLQQLFDRGNLSSPFISDQQVFTWLRPLLVYLPPDQATQLFSVIGQRSCSFGTQIVVFLNANLATLQNSTQTNIFSQILVSLQGSAPLRCYNNSQSFYGFLQSSFLSFGFPNLSTFLSLMPPSQMQQLVNSLSISDLGSFLNLPGVVDDNTKLCLLYSIYIQTPQFLVNVSIPDPLRRPTLTCVWPQALSSSQRSEVNAWFDLRLKNYLPYLTKSLVTSPLVQTATCLAYQKLISVLGSFNYSATDFVMADVYMFDIKNYLNSASNPKCYNQSDPELNSTAWFALNIGSFISYLTLDDLQTFGSSQTLQVFTVNQENIALLNTANWPLNLTVYYTNLVYQQDSNFNPMLLPAVFWCTVPGPAFSQLNIQQTMIVLQNLSRLCSNVDPQVASALAANSGDNINQNTIAALGNQSTGLSEGQVSMAPASVLWASLNTLSTVTGWNQGQAMAIIQSLLMSGFLQFTNASVFSMLGSLVVGLPSAVFGNVSATNLLIASQNPSFVTYLSKGPSILTQTVVTQLITLNTTSDAILQNIPDSMSPQIPRSMLLGFSPQNSVELGRLNQKPWKPEQAALFFDTVAEGFDSNDLSSSVLQGFTSTRVSSMSNTKVKSLILACRRGRANRVVLNEEQLTSMYNYIQNEPDLTSYTLYPPDVMLYYNYKLVPPSTCRQYFSNLGNADFSVFSNTLNYMQTALINNAKTCLGIKSTVLNSDIVQVLGNMVCVLDGSYIQNSDQLILQNLQTCNDLSDGQVAAIETLLFSGATQYGAPANWTLQTLKSLGSLPLYLTASFYSKFSTNIKQQFLVLLGDMGISRQKISRLKAAIRQSIINQSKSKRSIVTNCTETGQITQVTISEPTFPFNYLTAAVFNSCLTAKTVNDNLAAITAKVDDPAFLSVVLARLREAYQSTIPEMKVQVLGPASRVATFLDITMWNITTIDTLSALMDPTYGDWDPITVQAIISKYLSNPGNILGSAELNSIRGTNLCYLDVNVLKTITQMSLSLASALTVTNCSLEAKQVLFSIAQGAFQTRASTVSATAYQLIQPYLGGANYAFVQILSVSNISMDLSTFTGLDPGVILNLTVTQVKGLLGSNLLLLTNYQNQSVVRKWISNQFQSDLDSLGLGLTGGKADPVSPGVGVIMNSTTAGLAPAGNTTGSGETNRPAVGLQLLLTTLTVSALYWLQ
ncbi:uncharacterized protein mslnb isoform X4 [Esox lucius]|uniref:uncharacterized protein mslnb isoform X4 n=1 Tax=Esox lucius TaxID=8010 RepID=UPI0014773808|nr:uncharacterized protein mslnb isoform X4 [Esox lucius]